MKALFSKSVFFLCLLFNFTNSAYAQLKETYAAGTIELQDGQTIKGFIKEGELGDMNYKIRFKLSETDKNTTDYDTSQLKSYNLNGNEFFELQHISVNGGTVPLSVLAKSILNGKASLYKFIYDNEAFYTAKNEEQLYVLQNDKLSAGSTEVSRYYFKNYLKAATNSTISDLKLETVGFTEKDFIKVFTEYNNTNGSGSKLVATKEKPISYIIAGIGGMIKNSNSSELFAQATYRIYFPKISRSTSLNVGINYFSYKYLRTAYDSYRYTTTTKYTSTLFSIPFQLQQNILNKNIRPYVFGGLNASYYKVVNDKGTSQLETGFQSTFGIGLIYGGGIEVDIFKGLLLKSEYRYEIYSHLVVVGIGYNFSKR